MTYLQKSDEGKVMALHYIDGIDFPFLHKLPYPSGIRKKKVMAKDSHTRKLSCQPVHIDRRPQHQRGG